MQKTTQMTITGYTDATFQEIVGKPLIFTVATDSYALSDSLNFEIVLDSSNCIIESQADMEKAIAALKSVMYRYDGCIHAPNFVMIEWGEVFSFKGTIRSFDVSYSLFRPDGVPLKAKIGLSYVAFRAKTVFPN